jgi:hypothetical protein
MTAELIAFPAKSGVRARAALIDATRNLPGRDPSDAEFLADWILGELWMRGFKVVPLEDGDD